jgi:DNA replication protein DnaC
MSERLKAYCRQMRIVNLAPFIEQVDYIDKEQFITETLALASKQRETERIKALVRVAGFPSPKTLDGYEFEPITLPHGLTREQLTSLEFLDKKENLLLLGAVGTGKTHLASALGLKACAQGKKVKFYRTADLATTLVDAWKLGTLGKFTRTLAKLDLLILDEVGYVPMSKQAAELLFTVISGCYEQQSIIVTSNLELGRWNEVFGDDRLTAALIDRLIHHAHILSFAGESYRFRQALRRARSAED